MTVRFLAAAAIATAAPLLAVSPTAHAESATVVGEASCLYGGPSWMSSWTVTSASPYSVYGAGLERTHQFDELSTTLEVLRTSDVHEQTIEIVSTTINHPNSYDRTDTDTDTSNLSSTLRLSVTRRSVDDEQNTKTKNTKITGVLRSAAATSRPARVHRAR